MMRINKQFKLISVGLILLLICLATCLFTLPTKVSAEALDDITQNALP